MDSKKSSDAGDEVSAKSPAAKDSTSSNPGRRRRERTLDEPIEAKDNSNDILDAAAKPRRRNRGGDDRGSTGGGWMSTDAAAQKKLSMMSMDDEEDKDTPTVTANKDKHFQEGEGDVLEIPDLDEEAGVDIDQRVAHAPRNVTRKIPTLSELEEEVSAAIPATEDGMNLGCLTSTLIPAALLYETDTPWTFESLLREVTEEISDLPKPATKAATGTNTTVKVSKSSGKNKSS